MKPLTLATVILCFPIIALSQSVNVAVGNTFSSLDWRYVHFDGSEEEFYTGALATNLSANLEVDYLNKSLYSLTSYLGFFQSGGEIAENETHENWIISEQQNRANNFSIGTNFNLIPVNNTLQLVVSLGPRLDYLVPFDNSAMAKQSDDLQQLHFGLSTGLGVFYKMDKMKLGVRGTYLARFTDYFDVAPYQSNNWWENSTLGIRAYDRFIINTQFVIGYSFNSSK